MYPLRLFSKLPSKRLAYEEFEECSIENEDRNQSVTTSTPRLAFVTTRAETGGVGDLSAPNLVHGITGDHVSNFDLSPPKAIQQGRKRNPVSALGVGDTIPELGKNEQLGAISPVRAAKRRTKGRTKLTWQSRASPDKQKHSKHGRSSSLVRIPFDYPRLDAAPDAVAVKSLQQSASFSGIGCKDSGLPTVMVGQGNVQNGGIDSMPSTPRGSRKPRNSELMSSITSLGSVTSAVMPRSASRSQRHGGPSSTSNALAAVGLPCNRATSAVGAGVRALFQNQLAAQLPTESRFQLEVDPTFWQDHNVQVLIRTRPINVSEVTQQGHGRCVRQESAHTITWIGQPETRFTFDHVAGEFVSQEELFRVAGLPMVENCIAGYNSCMFAYGQTGSGKTHTMLGDFSDLDDQPNDNRGMTPRVFESLFTKIKLAEEGQMHENLKFKCRCSFLEIYNEQIVDLLEPSSSNLQMREDANKGVYVEGLLEVEVQNVQDVLHLLLLGAASRRVAATNMNKESSRSHSVFTCTIESKWECDDMINFRFGRLNLVDLAGSERQRASGAEGERLKEAASINKSLSTLGLVIMVLVDTANGKQRHVPYRDSKLTFLLQDSLGGNSKTTIIANISPSSCASLETLSTLKFAQRAKFIQNNAIINEDTAGDVNVLRQQLQQLKDELARLRRQSISRIPTGRASAVFREEFIDEDNPSNSTEGLNNSIEGSFLHFGRNLQSPTVLNKKIQSLEAVLAGALRREQEAEFSLKKSAAEMEHLSRLVKQREEETQCSKMLLRLREDKIKRMEALSDGVVTTNTYVVEERNATLRELQLLRDEKGCNPEVTKFVMENMRLQEQLGKFEDFHINGEREAMAQEISNLRDHLAGVLDSKLSVDSLGHAQNDASAGELALERHLLGLLRTEVESYRRELDGCRTSLSACLTSNDDMGRQLTELRKELKVANESCSKYKKDLHDIQEETLKVDCLKFKHAEHQQFLFGIETQLRKSKEKASEEAKLRIQLENLVKETLQENNHLQTKFQWTNGALETAENLLKKLQLNQLSPVVGVKQSLEVESDQAYVINQLQLELGEVKSILEEERIRGRRLADQLTDYGNEEPRSLKRVYSSASHDSMRVRHQDAILQLQLELDTIDGAPESAIRSYRWEEGTRSKSEIEDVDAKHSTTIMQLQLDLESVEGRLEEERRYLLEVEASRARLQKQLEESVSRFYTEREAVLRLESCQRRTENDLGTLLIDHNALLEKVSKAEETERNLKQKITQLEWTLSREQELRNVELREQSKYGPVDRGREAVFNAEVERATEESEGTSNFNCGIRGEQTYPAVLEQEVQIVRPKVEMKADLVTVKENWNLKISASKVTAAETELQCTQIKKELCATKVEVQKLEALNCTAEIREEEMQNERAKLERKVKQHLEAVEVLADDLQNQIELKEQENLSLKEEMAEQYEDWVLERSEFLVATREAESRCIEKNKTITSLQRSMPTLQGPVSGADYKPRLQNAEVYKPVEGEVDCQLEDRVEELNKAIDRLTAENMELRNEKLFLSDHTGNKIQIVAQKEVESTSMKKKLLNAEEHQRQAESTVAALNKLVEELSTLEKSWLSEKEFLTSEVERLQICLETLELDFQSSQKERGCCVKRLAEMDENKVFLGSHANSSPVKGTTNAHVELRKAHVTLASSEEKLKLLTEMVSNMGEDWAAERQSWMSEKEDLHMELARWEQHSDFWRSSDQPLRNLSENRSLPAPDASFNTKNVGKLRQSLDKMRTENVKLRSRTREQDQAYLSVRMELSAALAKREDLEVEMDRIITEKQHMLQNEDDLRKQLEATSLEMTRRHVHIRNCESELQKLTMLLKLQSEEQMNAAQQEWREEKAQLEAERDKARGEANEKKNEAAAMLVKFEEWEGTLREADSMVNALVRVNEKAKERWRREKERLALTQSEKTTQVVLQMLQAVALTKDQADLVAGHAEGEIRALFAETQIMRLDMTHEILKLRGEISGNICHENSKSIELLPSAKCMDSERQSWVHQVEAASVALAQKEAEVCTLQIEVDKARKKIMSVQTLQTGTQSLLQEKDELNLKLVNELNHLNQSINRDRTLRQSLTRNVDDVTSLRSSFSCKSHVETASTLTILKEEQEQLKTMVFNLEVEKAELQEQLLEAETKTKALESTLEHFRKSDDLWIEEVRSLEEQLEESSRHVNELESQRMELRDNMQRQAASSAELYEHLQKQEGALEGEAQAITEKVAAENELLHTLQEEKAELKVMVGRLGAELTRCEKKASCAESSQADLESLRLEMERLRKELLRIDSLQKEIDVQNAKLDHISLQRTLLEADLASKNKELSEIAGELESKRILADLTARESEELKGHFEKLLEKTSVLEEEVTRKRTAMKALEAELMAVEETMARFLEVASVDLKDLETERDNLQAELLVLTDQLQETQALADEQITITDEARQNAELCRMRAEEKQVQAEILGRSVVELESTVYALESQLGLVIRESERQRLMREDMEMELQGLNNHMSVMRAGLEEATARNADDVLRAQFLLQEAERKLEEKDAEIQLAQTKLTGLLKDSEMKSEKIRTSKIQIAALLAEVEKKGSEYDKKLKAVEIKLRERVHSQPSIGRGPKLKGAWSTLACIGKGYHMNSEVNASRQMYERRIQELEIDLSNKQYEISILTGKLEAAERMTTEVLRDFIGGKTDMTNDATLRGQQEDRIAFQAQKEPLEKVLKTESCAEVDLRLQDEEVEHLLQRLNEFIEERESWLEEISRRHYDLLTAQDTIDKHQQRERVLCTDIENIKDELKRQRKIEGDLELEVKKLSGQQNLQQRIKHHAKIKDENNLLRIQNDELSGKLRRSKLLHARVSDELAKYRTAEGKTPLLNFDEEHRLHSKVQDLEDQKADLSQKLGAICARVVEAAAGQVLDPNRNCGLDEALEGLRQLRTRLESTQKDLEDYKLKVKIAEEKQKLNELRIVQSPLKDIGSFGALKLAPR